MSSVRHRIEIQNVTDEMEVPSRYQLRKWARLALVELTQPSTVLLRLVDAAEMTSLNAQFRGKSGPTNVLSFPAEPVSFAPNTSHFLGDIIICVPVVRHEALEQEKPFLHHCAHLVIHGVLHLLGYDHLKTDEAEIMEAREIALLAILKIKNPY